MCAQEEGDIMYKKIIILLGVVLLLGTGSSIIFRTDLVGSAEAGIAYSGKGIDVMVDDSSMWHSGNYYGCAVYMGNEYKNDWGSSLIYNFETGKGYRYWVSGDTSDYYNGSARNDTIVFKILRYMEDRV